MADGQMNELSNRQKLTQLQNVSTLPLLTIRTVFPFRFFPAVLTLDREKLTISDHFFFFGKQVENFLAKDIVSVTSTENGFFANLTFVSGMRINRKVSISYLWKDDAKRFRRILEGLLIASREGINTMNISDAELIKKLEEIGASQG